MNLNFEALEVDVVHHMPSEDGVYVKETRIPKGVTLLMHTHTFTHKSILTKGRVSLTQGGNRRQVIAPEILTLEKGTPHSVTALEDSVWLCVHATTETNPELIDYAITEA